MSEPCDRCTRRSWLVGRLSGHLDQIRGNRPAIRGVLALSDRKLIAALSGREKANDYRRVVLLRRSRRAARLALIIDAGNLPPQPILSTLASPISPIRPPFFISTAILLASNS